LAAVQIWGDVVFAQWQAGGDAFDDHREALAVALARREHAELAH